MIELEEHSKKHVLVFKGRPEKEGYENVFTPQLQNVLRRFDRAHIVFVWEGDMMGEELHDKWDAEEFARAHKDQVGKVAVVGSSKWREWAKKLVPHFGAENVQTYDNEHLAEATEWAEETKVV